MKRDFYLDVYTILINTVDHMRISGKSEVIAFVVNAGIMGMNVTGNYFYI